MVGKDRQLLISCPRMRAAAHGHGIIVMYLPVSVTIRALKIAGRQ